MEQLFYRYRMALDATPVEFSRYLDGKINWESPLIAILGARGVGKTTLIRQHIKKLNEEASSLYFDAGDIYFGSHTLYDVADKFFRNGGKHLYIDEVHRYQGWSTEIKMMHDFIPELQVVYTGSSILELEKGGADLSRRKSQYYLDGMSFREFLALKHNIVMPVLSLDETLKADKIELPDNLNPVVLFKEYLKNGFYPFGDTPDYYDKLASMVATSLEVDIQQFARMTPATVKKIKKLFYLLAQSVPFKPVYSQWARAIESDRGEIPSLLEYLGKTGLIDMVELTGSGLGAVSNPEKIFLDNTNLSYALCNETPNIGTLRETAFNQMVRVTLPVKASPKTDFKIGDYSFEVGGKNKGTQQIAGVEKSFVVRDDTLYRSLNFIPLWHFGFLY